MKDYPIIKRLSTLGIVHHQGFDYDFNPFRTDFVGEGGAGKSMISDILQLICVGTSAFHSPTKGTSTREPKTMVLRTDGNGTDMGYAFINVEVEKNKFIVIGIYLESAGTSNMFIIQEGNNFDDDTQLIPFETVLGYSDFLKNNQILPIQNLKEHISNTLQLTCESWHKTSNYHKILFKNEILPIDLSISNKTLDNYAKIIQAFSRESLDMNKSEKLQSFLFGEEKEKELLEKFNQTVKELNGDTKEFDKNLNEIELLTDKQKALSELLKLKNEKDKNEQIYLLASFNHYSKEITNSENEIREKINLYEDSSKILIQLKTIVQEKIISTKEEIEIIDPKWETAFIEKNKWEESEKKLKKFFSWLQDFNCSEKEILKEKYNKYHQNKLQITQLRELTEKLKSKNILTFFTNENLKGKNVLVQINSKTEVYKKELEIKNKLKALNNIEDKKSLAHWALNQTKKLDLFQESIIHKYHNENIKVDAPLDDLLRYIPEPNQLIENLKISNKNDKGFWIDLNGLMEHISLIESPIFDKEDKEEIKEYFQKQTFTIEEDILNLERKLANIELLIEVLEQLESPDDYILAFNSDIGLEEQLENHEMYEVSNIFFDDYFDAFSREKEINEQFTNARTNFRKLEVEKRKLDNLNINLERELESFLTPIIIDEIDDYKNKYNFISTKNLDLDSLNKELNEAEDYYIELKKAYNTQISNNNQTESLKEIDLKISNIKHKKNEIYSQNPNLFTEEIVMDIYEDIEINELEKKSNNANNDYISNYNFVVYTFLKQKNNQYKDTGDFSPLCREILPQEIFDEKDLLDADIIENISNYLRNINIKNRKLNSRKLQKLSEIIDDVSNEVSSQLMDIRIISNFLNSEEKKITGGHKVDLDVIYDNVFKKEWMNNFTEEINKDIQYGMDESLFETLKTFSTELESFPTLEEKLKEAFYRTGGTRANKLEVRDLLNPKSYYGLKFSIKSAQGNKTAGSTSQTYSAIALLCMAKLSLIDKTSKSKIRKGIRYMAIDEAEGLGSNFDMLYNIAKANDYQILSLSINPNKIDAENQNIYLLHNSLEDENINYTPVPIFGSSNN
ncbi:DNA repair protein Rad50 [Flavobacterium psychrophilum]|uniref:DNA repair protein Rad50 n=1 Tax=Flavobacterium psychrophilum TaxID=96345 RepID=UPI00106DAAA8|nr:DNA repair protein Rad50 [Flavobacterium psychrophilum]